MLSKLCSRTRLAPPPTVRADRTVAGQWLMEAIDDVAELVSDAQYLELMDAARALYFSA